MAFHEDNKIFGSHHIGKYLGILELIAKYDQFLEYHIIQFGNKGRGTTPYLTSTIWE